MRSGSTGAGEFPAAPPGKLHSRVADRIELLGVVFDSRIGFTGKFGGNLQCANLERDVLARLPRRTWGLEGTLLRSAYPTP